MYGIPCGKNWSISKMLHNRFLDWRRSSLYSGTSICGCETYVGSFKETKRVRVADVFIHPLHLIGAIDDFGFRLDKIEAVLQILQVPCTIIDDPDHGGIQIVFIFLANSDLEQALI